MDQASSRRTTVSMRNLRLTALFQPGDVLHHVGSIEEADLINRLLEHLALEYGIGSVKVAYDEVTANMKKESVHVAPGMAVVSGRLERVLTPLVAMATFTTGIQFAGRKVYLVAAILTPLDMPGVNKQIQHALRKACDGEGQAKAVARKATAEDVWKYFDERGQRLPDHLQARHIMSKPDVCLQGDDSLAQAIDLFLAHRLSELPVVNADNELLGVVTTQRLVHVCMPDYLMWVEDLTPFLNFEPIAEIIRNESSTWLREIMVHNFAQVAEDSPAILALKEIGRRETDNAYVLRGRQLVGIIQLHEFLNSVLR